MPLEQHNKSKRVVIVQRILPHYRRRFFELLRERLADESIELIFVHGQPDKIEMSQVGNIQLDWAQRIVNRNIYIGNAHFVWQPCLPYLKGADLVIMEQASRLLLNYVLFVGQIFGGRKLCFWGHGKNFKEHRVSTVGEYFKNVMSRRVHWWFAYNDWSAEIVRDLGYPAEQITSVQNAIDTTGLMNAMRKVTSATIEQLKKTHHIAGNNICYFSGAMYEEKRIDFLIEACLQIKRIVPDFEMIFMGGGPDEQKVRAAAEQFPWLHYLGPKFEDERAPFMMMSKLLLMPGLVGLVILDALIMEKPTVTMAVPYHSPEIHYLIDQVNGVVVRDAESPTKYATAVAGLLNDTAAYERLVAGCRIFKGQYAIENMVENFASGIVKALQK